MFDFAHSMVLFKAKHPKGNSAVAAVIAAATAASMNLNASSSAGTKLEFVFNQA